MGGVGGQRALAPGEVLFGLCPGATAQIDARLQELAAVGLHAVQVTPAEVVGAGVGQRDLAEQAVGGAARPRVPHHGGHGGAAQGKRREVGVVPALVHVRLLVHEPMKMCSTGTSSIRIPAVSPI